MFIDGVHIESNFSSQAGLNDVFNKMSGILNHYAPQEEPKYDSKSLHPMISMEQALKELLAMSKNETPSSQ